MSYGHLGLVRGGDRRPYALSRKAFEHAFAGSVHLIAQVKAKQPVRYRRAVQQSRAARYKPNHRQEVSIPRRDKHGRGTRAGYSLAGTEWDGYISPVIRASIATLASPSLGCGALPAKLRCARRRFFLSRLSSPVSTALAKFPARPAPGLHGRRWGPSSVWCTGRIDAV